MKKYNLFLFSLLSFAFVFGLFTINVNSASAENSCALGFPFDSDTGFSCTASGGSYVPVAGTLPVGCDHVQPVQMFSRSIPNTPCVYSGSGSSANTNFIVTDRTLKVIVGATLQGTDIMLVQQALQRAGYSLGIVDGKYGPRTATAVSAFQEDHSLPVSGEVDANTLMVINTLSFSSATTTNSTPSSFSVNTVPNGLQNSYDYQVSSTQAFDMLVFHATCSDQEVSIDVQGKILCNTGSHFQFSPTTNYSQPVTYISKDGKNHTVYMTVTAYRDHGVTLTGGTSHYDTVTVSTSSSVSLSSPTTGSSITQGQTLRIAWNTTNAPAGSYVGKVNLFRGDALVQSIVSTNSYSASDLMDWGVSSAITPADNYRIQVQVLNADGSILAQTFGGYFRVVAPATTPSFSVVSPNGGEVWQVGSTQTIRWNVGDSSIRYVNFELRTAPVGTAGVTGRDLYLQAVNAGSLTFVLPSSYPLGTYFLQLKKTDETLLDESNSPFTITSGTITPTVSLSSPTTGSSITQGQTLRIAWNTTNAPAGSYVGKVNLFRGDALVQSIVSTNSYSASDLMDWGVSSAIAPGDNYRIQVQVLNADGSILAQTFGGYFRVVASTQTSAPLSITTSSPIPNAKVGQSYSTNLVATGGTSGTPYTWSLSTSAGGTSLPNGMSLSQTGTISGTPTIAGTYFFYVICSSGSQNIQRPFTLTVDPATVVASGPSLTITTPNGGEVVHYGDRLPIKWSQTGFTVNSSPHVDVYISPQDGRGDIIIGTNISVFDGSSGLVAGIDKQRVVNGVTYTLPFTPGTYKAKIVCQASNIAEFRGCSDVSDAVFTIVDTTTALNTSGSAVLGAESFHFTQFLSEGSQGNEVKELQKYLNDRGYGAGNVDGNFGSQVKDALMRFQTDNGLKSDGIVGYEVRTWLNK